MAYSLFIIVPLLNYIHRKKNFHSLHFTISTNISIIQLVVSNLSQDIISGVRSFFPLHINYKPSEIFKVFMLSSINFYAPHPTYTSQKMF